MINRQIMSELLKKKPRSTVYHLIEKIRENSRYMVGKEDAACILAGNLRIDIGKYLPPDELQRLRSLDTDVKTTEIKKKRDPEIIDLKIKGVPANIPYLRSSTARDCTRMSDTYQTFYLLENSVRSFICTVLDAACSSTDWWAEKVPSQVKEKVEKRIYKEKQNRWHAQRAAHRIYYTDFGDLKDIIVKSWDSFRRFFPNQAWVVSKLSELELSRNIIAHNNPLPAKEVGRIKLYFGDWTKQVKGA